MASLVLIAVILWQGQYPAGQPASRPADQALPKVLLIGDSISIQYTRFVQKRLAGKAVVKRIPTNGGSTARGLQYIDEWLGKEHWDVIHFNFGAHDLMVMRDGKQQVPIAQYEENLRKLVERLRRTGARLIWASTTPVPDGKLALISTLGIQMKDTDVIAYNAVAAKIMKEHSIPVDDLYGFAKPKLSELQIPRDVHLTIRGADALSEPVANSILAALGYPSSSQPATSRPAVARSNPAP